MAIMYSSAIFYPAEIIPEEYAFILKYNPLYYYIDGFRNVVYLGQTIDVHNLLICSLIAIFSLFLGIVIFQKNQHKFIFYL
jgi:ABC-type polysaccharide/polyol phosphate export permease